MINIHLFLENNADEAEPSQKNNLFLDERANRFESFDKISIVLTYSTHLCFLEIDYCASKSTRMIS